MFKIKVENRKIYKISRWYALYRHCSYSFAFLCQLNMKILLMAIKNSTFSHFIILLLFNKFSQKISLIISVRIWNLKKMEIWLPNSFFWKILSFKIGVKKLKLRIYMKTLQMNCGSYISNVWQFTVHFIPKTILYYIQWIFYEK